MLCSSSRAHALHRPRSTKSCGKGWQSGLSTDALLAFLRPRAAPPSGTLRPWEGPAVILDGSLALAGPSHAQQLLLDSEDEEAWEAMTQEGVESGGVEALPQGNGDTGAGHTGMKREIALQVSCGVEVLGRG